MFSRPYLVMNQVGLFAVGCKLTASTHPDQLVQAHILYNGHSAHVVLAIGRREFVSIMF